MAGTPLSADDAVYVVIHRRATQEVSLLTLMSTAAGLVPTGLLAITGIFIASHLWWEREQ